MLTSAGPAVRPFRAAPLADQQTKRESGRKAQVGNIRASKAVADIIRTTLGPRSMLKMLLDATGGIVLTNDGNAILREIDVSHPAAKSMIELSRTQDEEVGDGTTSVIILAGEILAVRRPHHARYHHPLRRRSPTVCCVYRFRNRLQVVMMVLAAEPFLEKNIHPTVIVRAFMRALDDAIKVIDEIAFPFDSNDGKQLRHRLPVRIGDVAQGEPPACCGADNQMLNIVQSCIGTKFTNNFGPLMSVRCPRPLRAELGELALKAVKTVAVTLPNGAIDIDIKKYAKVEKIPGGNIEECRVLSGVMFQKDVVTPGRMKRSVEHPRVLLLDCPLEYKKGENQTNVELMQEEDWATLLRMEEEWIEQQCAYIAAVKPDVVITEKGLSDLASHFLGKAGISAIRRLRKTDNNRIARATGATIVHRCDEIKESDVGTKAGLFEVKKLGDEYFTFLVDCEDPKACTIILRGASRDVLNEV
eukprot:scaffold4501_cov395-Prasinococcus_capsulatus_cf.AAC.2